MLPYAPLLLFLIPFMAALVCAVLAWFSIRLTRCVMLASLTANAGVALFLASHTMGGQTIRDNMGGWPPPIGIELMVDSIGAIMAVVVALISLITVGGSLPIFRRDFNERDAFSYPCMLLLISGLMGMIVTHDLFNMFVHLEVVSLCAYCLVAAGGRGAPGAAMKYLILGSLGASTYLLGVGFIYAATGSLNMSDVAQHLSDGYPKLVLVGTGLIAVGLAVKMGLFPLHSWMPAAYSLSPTTSASLMAPLVTKVSAYALLRILYWVYGWDSFTDETIVSQMLCWAGAAAVVVGGLLAFQQDDFRRLLAYSSVSQMGIIAIGIGLADSNAFTGAVLQIINDAVMKCLLFMSAAMILLQFEIRNVSDLWRLRGRAPWTSAAITVAGFSLIGLPPFCGFFGKWYVLAGAMEGERWGLAAAIVIGSLATAAYVFRILEQLYFKEQDKTEQTTEGPWSLVVAVVLLAVAVVAIGLGSERIVTTLIQPVLLGGAS